MGVEYYIVKNKEVYYLGRGNWYLEGFQVRPDKADYILYDDYEDLFFDILRSEPFSEYYVEQIRDLAYDIFGWCDNKVYITSDCDDDFNVERYKETGSILNVWKSFKENYQNLFTLEEELDEVLDLIPPEFYVKNKNNVILTIPTIVKYVKESKNDQR